MPHTPYTYAAAYLLLIKDGQILLLRRYNTGFQDGNYSLPAGHVEPGENFTQTIIREAKEEAGVIVTEEELKAVHVLHRLNPHERTYVDVFFITEKWSGEPENKEPEKCDDLSWFPLTNLPENTVPYIRQAIEHYLKKVHYSEFGWK